jgi:transposase
MDHVSTFAIGASDAVSEVYLEGLSGRAAALRLKLSPGTGARWARQVRTKGHAEPAPQGPPRGRGKLAPYQALLEELIAQDPDITLFELRDALADAAGVRVHHSSIANLLARLGFSCKKVAGGHRTPPCQGKAETERLVQTSAPCHCRLAGPCCLH